MAGKRKAASSGPKLRVTWVKSTIGHKAGARGTIRALGLHRLHQTVEVADTPVTRGHAAPRRLPGDGRRARGRRAKGEG